MQLLAATAAAKARRQKRHRPEDHQRKRTGLGDPGTVRVAAFTSVPVIALAGCNMLIVPVAIAFRPRVLFAVLRVISIVIDTPGPGRRREH